MYWWTTALLLAGSGLLTETVAFPANFDHRRDDAPIDSHPFADFGPVGPSVVKRADKPDLRILPLGASIMSGVGSSNGNGLRKPLRDALRFDGYEVDMVGGRNSGTMKDNDHEAVPGDILTEIRTRLQHALGYKANVIIINGGTNDAVRNIDTGNAYSRMNDILNDIWNSEDMGESCVILSTLLDTSDPTGTVQRITINNQYRTLVNDRKGDGKCIVLADMDPEEGSQHGWIDAWENWRDYTDNEDPHTHPNDEGHKKMAYIFYKGILKVLATGQVMPPSTEFEVADPVCDKFSGTGLNPGGKTQRGTGNDDDVYRHYSEEMGIVWTAESEWDRDQWRFARLYSNKYDDFVAWVKVSSTENVFAVWANSADGKGNFAQVSDLSPGMYCEPAGQYFIDMNGDGLDDFVCIDSKGNAHLSINNGDGNRSAGKPPSFKALGQIKTAETSSRSNVRMGDIDGDGRGDYIVIDKLGTVTVWRNGWVDDKPKYWQALGTRWTDQYTRDITGVQFHDINGDGRDDWLWTDKTGATTTFTNSRSCKKGVEGNGLNVAWRQGFFETEGTGPTHKGVPGYVTKDESDLRKRVHFARVYGGSSSFGNLSLKDYVFLEHTKLSNGNHSFKMRIWKNTGGGASKLKMDGNKYCNMVGHEDGRSDYVWVWSNGKMELFMNRGKKAISDNDAEGFWDWSPGVIWTPPSAMHRLDLHLADWDGDGACDIIYVNPETNALRVFINNYPKSNKWEFSETSAPSPGCGEKRGVGINDLAVRFADLTGNKRADFLCLRPDGYVSGALHQNDGSFKDVGQIKVAEGHDRAMLRFADVNGDGKDDFLWIEKFSGDTFVWYNGGEDSSRPLGSAFYWRQQTEKAYAGLAAGTCLFYTDLSGDWRADEHYVLESLNNIAETSFSPACGLSNVEGDDPEGVVDPQLPVRPDDNGDDEVPDGVCAYPILGTTQLTLQNTWEKSGAADHLNKYFKTHGTDGWSTNYLYDILGTQHDCGDIFSTTCTPPTSQCSTYDPNEAFFVHQQIANLHSGMFKWWGMMVNDSVSALGSDITDIVDTYGTPSEDPVTTLNMLVGLFTSLAGIAGTIGDAVPGTTAAGLGKFVNPMTLIAGVIAITATNDLNEPTIDPEDLEKNLKKSYSQMFSAISDRARSTLEATLNGKPLSGEMLERAGVASMQEYIQHQFADGAWLSSELIGDLVDAMAQNVFQKFREYALVKAIKTNNKRQYIFLVTGPKAKVVYNNELVYMSQEACESMSARVWHDDLCLAMGYTEINVADKQVWKTIGDTEADGMKQWIKDFRAAMVNNYECYKKKGSDGKLDDPEFPKPFDATATIEYPQCFWNIWSHEDLD
ncbi:hypothetical protein CGCSCA4_v001725 [Colletotrichum siamense]|uniref:SGNH hydrolase-type esterase domain-containing protein n=1 Tax=Colletotrichum siamense TaxID=690259 RepID=A0A9P5F0Z5_COLSI|nr:hypothetical protein CGCSCA4_v001725 [Colletotrichum siamense]KAF4864798.1 hypothetical protein CGCSCA2_v001861 [Colletotrichum siamense]